MDINMLVYRVRRSTLTQKHLMLKLLKEASRKDIVKILQESFIKSNVSRSSGQLYKSLKQETRAEYLEINNIVNNLLTVDVLFFERKINDIFYYKDNA
ncbi:hypothetical protein [Klebsiella pneumoniae]|uniref:hypothetical protein n=1 Tax=Klebsiella pneumoniae TaxID=573 RepID=UPI0013304A53|nr:hypothetical protein [Klebsiella pneumoniae]